MSRHGVEDWLQDLMPRLPGATEELIKRETFAAVRELCEDGRAWSHFIDNISSTANNPRIYINPLPDDTRVGYILGITFNPSGGIQRALRPVTTIPSQRFATGQDPIGYYMEDPGTVILLPTPTLSHQQKYTIDVSLIPTNENADLPEVFMTHWRDAIIDGVCGRMMIMSGKPWTNMTTAMYHGRRFRNHIKRCRAITDSKFTPGQSWRFPDFAMQRRGGF